MKSVVSCTINDGVALITLDDGNTNAITPLMIEQINRALDQAEDNRAVALLTGRSGIFSSGFELKTLKTGVANSFKMIVGAFKLSRRMLAFPFPVVVACNGHAMAMGSFLLLSADFRIGTLGDYKIVANEVQLGMTVPYTAVELCRAKLKPAHFDRVVSLSETYNPETSIEAGFLDEVVPENQLLSSAMHKAKAYVALDYSAHSSSKLRMRKDLLASLDRAIKKDILGFLALGLKHALRF